MAKRVISGELDNVIILANSASADYITSQPDPLPEDVILIANIGDIWIRDFSSVDGVRIFCGNQSHRRKGGGCFVFQELFKYKPNYLEPENSNWIQNTFINYITGSTKCDLSFPGRSSLVVDGGNVVYQWDTAILTKRVYSDNKANTNSAKVQVIPISELSNPISFHPFHSNGMDGMKQQDVISWIKSPSIFLMNPRVLSAACPATFLLLPSQARSQTCDPL